MYHRCHRCCRLALLLLSIQLQRETAHAFSNYPSSITPSPSSFPSITYRTCTNNNNKNPRATNPLRRKQILFSSSSSKDNFRSRSKRQRRNILNGSMLIAGTTVGGGFLALPTVVAPNGFIPSAITLVAVWAYFWMESLVLAECLILTRQISMQQADGEDKKGLETIEASDTNVMQEKDTRINPGISAAARAAFGSVGEKVVLILLVVLTEATLVSQIARAGKFFSPFYRVGCTIVAISMAGLVFGTPNNVVTETNSILTILFCILAVLLFGAGAPAADWSNLQQFSSWANISQAIPTFLQLLVYGEILPAICRLLDYQFRPIRWAITIGSILPLILEVGWAALGIGLLPVTTSSAGATRLGISTASDPVDLLLGVGPVRLPLFALAITAITTTIIGSYLALQSAMDDVFPFSHVSEFNGNNNDDGDMTQAKDDEKLTTIRSTRRRKNRRRAIISTMLIVLPALGIASISPNLFLQAIDFAGSYPVLLLWGMAPAAIDYWLRQKHFSRTKNSSTTAFANSQYSLLPKWWLLFVSSLSFLLFSMSAVPDLISLMRRILKFI